MSKFGDWLRERRTELKMLQSDVARRAGVSTSYISTLERGQKHSITGAELRPEPNKVIAISKAISADPDEALRLNGYLPQGSNDQEGLFSGYDELPPDRKQLARRQIRAILDSLADPEEHERKN